MPSLGLDLLILISMMAFGSPSSRRSSKPSERLKEDLDKDIIGCFKMIAKVMMIVDQFIHDRILKLLAKIAMEVPRR